MQINVHKTLKVAIIVNLSITTIEKVVIGEKKRVLL